MLSFDSLEEGCIIKMTSYLVETNHKTWVDYDVILMMHPSLKIPPTHFDSKNETQSHK